MTLHDCFVELLGAADLEPVDGSDGVYADDMIACELTGDGDAIYAKVGRLHQGRVPHPDVTVSARPPRDGQPAAASAHVYEASTFDLAGIARIGASLMLAGVLLTAARTS